MSNYSPKSLTLKNHPGAKCTRIVTVTKGADSPHSFHRQEDFVVTARDGSHIARGRSFFRAWENAAAIKPRATAELSK